MKVTRRMAKILIYLLYDGTAKWSYPDCWHSRARTLSWRIKKVGSSYGDMLEALSGNCRWQLSYSEKTSTQRTKRIMRKLGLITENQHGNLVLTEKGKQTAMKLDKEVRRYLKDFSFLLEASSDRKAKDS